jgi:hypothetical protein
LELTGKPSNEVEIVLNKKDIDAIESDLAANIL